MSVLICGSLAFDTIMVFPDRFREHILPDKLHMLNVAFLVPEMRREYGGTAGNIAYNLHGLGGDARIMATVGDDFGPTASACRLSVCAPTMCATCRGATPHKRLSPPTWTTTRSPHSTLAR
jgi:sugar/nucleoside kinase (ribokinase family)